MSEAAQPSPACSNCRFAFNNHLEILDCRRNAPITVSTADGVFATAWPDVYRHFWCGEYERGKEGIPHG